MVLTNRQIEKKNKRIKILELEINNGKISLENLENSISKVLLNDNQTDINEALSLFDKIIESKHEISKIELKIKNKINELKELPNKIKGIKDKEYNIWKVELERIDSKIEDNKIIEFDKMIELEFDKFTIEEELIRLDKELKSYSSRLSRLGRDKRYDKRNVLTAFVNMRKEKKESLKKKELIDNEININDNDINDINELINLIPNKEREINNNYYKLINFISEKEDEVKQVQSKIDNLIQKQNIMNIDDELYKLITEKENIMNSINELKEKDEYNIMENLKELDEEHKNLISKKEWLIGKKNKLTRKTIELSTLKCDNYQSKIDKLNNGINELNDVKLKITELKKEINDNKVKLSNILNNINLLKLELSQNNDKLNEEMIRANKRYNIMKKRIERIENNGVNDINIEINKFQDELSYAKLIHYNNEQLLKNNKDKYDNYKKYLKIKNKIKLNKIELNNKISEYNNLLNDDK